MGTTFDFCRNEHHRAADLYRGRKRACRTKPALGITLKKGDVDTHPDHKGCLYSILLPGRKIARKSKPPVQQTRVDDAGGLISRKRKSSSLLELNPRLLHIVESDRNEWTMDKRRKIEEALRLNYSSKDVIPGCGRLDQYETLGFINRGSYGGVYRALDKRSGEVVAVKDEYEGLSISSLKEIHILTSLPPHPCIVELKDVVVDDTDGLYVVMESMKYDLRGYMMGRELSVGEIKMLMKKLLEGVKFLHQNMVMHRDIKPSNILVSEEGVLKLCDFGLSRRFEAAGGLSNWSHVGTLPYRAPELLEGGEGPYSCAVDMWAVGCTMGEMLTKELLFGGQASCLGQLHAIHAILDDDDQLGVTLSGAAPLLSEAGLDLVRKLLCYDPTHRITAESALDHAWFTNLPS